MLDCNFCVVFQIPCDRGRPCGHCIRKGYSHLCSDAPPSPSSSTTPPTTAALRKRRREPSSSSSKAAVVDQRKNQQFGDLLQAVGLLTAEVRDLAADNRQMRADLEAMRGQQHATNQQLTSLLKLTTTPIISSATLTVTPPPLPTSSTMWPSRALMEAMRELPFLHDYPSLAGFAIPDFRFPVLACVYPGNTIFDPVPPTILFANAAMCRLSGYTFRELVGALVTKVVVMQESARLKMGPFLSNKDPLSLSPVYSFNTLIRSRSGRLWRTYADSTQFFFGENGTPKHIVVNLTQWEEGHLREGEVIDHWEGMTSGLPQLPLDLDRLAFARAHARCGRRATCSTNASAGDTHKLWPALPARAIADDDDDANGDGSFFSSSSSSSSSRSSSPPSPPPTEEMALILQLLDSTTTATTVS